MSPENIINIIYLMNNDLKCSGDLGKDFEHCLELQKKLDDVDGDMRVDESRIAEVGN